MKCCDCKNAFLSDYGYSNYTTEGTNVYCMLGLHPNDGFDNFYKEEEKNGFAKNCPSFDPDGPGFRMDVDRECTEDLKDNPQAEKWYKEHSNDH